MYDKNTQISTAETRERERERERVNSPNFFNKNSFRFIAFFLILSGSFLFVGIGQASAATYYVVPVGTPGNTPTAPYDTWTKAASLPETVFTAGNGVAGPHTVYIAHGTYSSYMNASNANWASGTIIGTAASGSTAPAIKGQVIISATAGQHGFITNRANVSMSNISITGTDATHDGIYISGNSFTGTNLYLYDSGRDNLRLEVGTGLTITRSLFAGCGSNASIRMFGGINNSTISYSIIRNSVNKLNVGHTILFGGSGILNINNSVITGGGNYGIYSSTGTINLKNSYVGAGINGQAAIYITSGKVVNATNNLLIGYLNGNRTVQPVGSLTIDTNNIKTLSPLFTKHTMSGMIVLSIDDSTSIDYVEAVEPILASYGVKGTYYIEETGITPSVITRLNSLISRGTISIGSHSYSHSDVSLTGNIYSITKAGATINVDRAADTITVTPGGTVTGFKAKTLAAIQTELQTLGCTVGTLPTHLQSYSLGEIMTDSGGAQASPYTPQLLIDTTATTGYFKTEIADPKAFLEANLTGYTGKSLATPWSATSANVQTAVKNAGYLSERNAYIGSLGSLLNNIDLYQMGAINPLTLTDDTTIRSNVIGIAEAAAQYGTVIAFLAHNTTELTVHGWDVFLNELQTEYPDVLVTDMDTAVDTIRNGGLWATADNRTYTRTFTDQSDYNLLSASPAIDAGTDVSLTTDYTGTNSIYGAPDIGTYEYQPPYTVGTTPVPTSGSIRIYSNNKYRALIATTTATTIPAANFSVTPVGGFYTASTSQYMDITIDTWETAVAKNKKWTATSSIATFNTHATSTAYTIGDLRPNIEYIFVLDGAASTAITDNAQCTSGICTANDSGVISFTYTGGYSTHTFALEDTTPPVLTEITPITTPTIDTTPSYVFSSTEPGTLLYAGSCTPDSTSISSGSNTVTFNALSYGTYTDCMISVVNSAGNDSATTTLASFTVKRPSDTQQGIITVINTVINDNGGTKAVDDFPLFVNGTQVTSGTATSFPAPANSYTISETTNSRYTQSFSGDCDSSGHLTLSPGDYKTCTVTNNDIATASASSGSSSSTITAPVTTSSSQSETPANTSGLSQTQIQSILALLSAFGADANTIANVQSALSGGTPPVQHQVLNISRDLKLNSTGNDVQQLQRFLNSHGFTVANTGAGSKGNETTTFGSLTKSALIKFQKANNITPAVGYFGPLTRAVVEAGG